MTNEELRALIITLILGTVITGAGAAALYLVFRRFGERGAGGSTHMGWIGALITFVFASCALLLFLAYHW